MTINDQVFTRATQLLTPVLNDFAKSLASSIAPLLPRKRGNDRSVTTSSAEEQRLQTLRETMAREHQEALSALNASAWSDAAIARIPDLNLVHFAYEQCSALRQEFATLGCFEAYWKNLCGQKIRRVARDEQGNR